MRTTLWTATIVGSLYLLIVAPAMGRDIAERLIGEQSACTRGFAVAHAALTRQSNDDEALAAAVNLAQFACKSDDLVVSLYHAFKGGSGEMSLEESEALVLEGIELQVRRNLETLRRASVERESEG